MTKYLTPRAGVLLREPEDGGGGLREVLGPVQGQAQVSAHPIKLLSADGGVSAGT